MPAPISVISASRLGFVWPDGTPVLRDLDLLVSPGRSGLVGVNGAGKSTLLRLVAGELSPTAGHVAATGVVGYLPQDLHLDVRPAGRRLPGHRRRASGRCVPSRPALSSRSCTTPSATTGTSRTVPWPSSAGSDCPRDVLDRRLGELSGGEVVQLGLARLLLGRPDVLVLDEPTNNLDADARHRLYDLVEGWTPVAAGGQPRPRAARADGPDRRPARRRGPLVRRRLLVVRRPGRGRAGGRRAGGDQRAVRRTTPAQRPRRGGAGARPAPAHGARRRSSPRDWARARSTPSATRRRSRPRSTAHVHDDRLERARERLDDAESRLREDREIRVDLPGTEVPRGRVVLEAPRGERSLEITGPDRIGVIGPNGSGKTTLLHTLVDQAQVPVALLPQRLDLLDEDAHGRGQRRSPLSRRGAPARARAAGPVPLPGHRGRPVGR